MIRRRSPSSSRRPPLLVRSTHNPRIVAAAKLHRTKERRRANRTLIEGPNLIACARAAGYPLEVVFALEEEEGVVQVTEEVMRYLAPTRHPRGPVAVMEVPSSRTATRACLVAYDLSDPGNLGTLIRTAAAFGMDVGVTAASVDVWAPKTLRSGAGGHFATSIEREVEIDDLRSRGFSIVAAVPRGGADPDVLRGLELPAILIGSEAHGVPEDLDVDLGVTIPVDVESLNAAVAAGILAYEYGRVRRREGSGPGAELR
jgi:TrmH family RNA methyltransferase